MPPRVYQDRFEQPVIGHTYKVEDNGIGTQYNSFKMEKQPVGSSMFMSDSIREVNYKTDAPGPAYYKGSHQTPKKPANQRPKKIWL